MTSSTDDRRAARSSPRGTSKGTRASLRVRLARTMRWATVGSGTRNARAISSVVRPPSKRSVSATRASVERTGWQAVNTRRRRSSPMSSSIALSKSATAIFCCASSSRPSSSCLRSSSFFLRNKSIARCFAVAISQAPGLSGTPDSGHCSSAATRASCASSSARPTSRTIRARPAMILADSILQIASIARCVSVAVTATQSHHLQSARASLRARRLHVRGHRYARGLLCFGTGVFRPVHLANLGLAFPARPVFLVKFHEAQRSLDRLFLRFQVKDCDTANDFLGFGEGPVGRGYLPPRNPDACASRSWGQPAACDHRAGFDRLFAELRNRVHEFLGRSARVLGVLDQHHESHCQISFLFCVGSWVSEPFQRARPSLHLHVE